MPGDIDGGDVNDCTKTPAAAREQGVAQRLVFGKAAKLTPQGLGARTRLEGGSWYWPSALEMFQLGSSI